LKLKERNFSAVIVLHVSLPNFRSEDIWILNIQQLLLTLKANVNATVADSNVTGLVT
jgi:hypothetical protein